ncbi:MAG TPA: YCF48-related protein [Ktedonobacteraceae bacterium]|nr:YCF48-related protein [Ktedonobacteraceae bacterium]
MKTARSITKNRKSAFQGSLFATILLMALLLAACGASTTTGNGNAGTPTATTATTGTTPTATTAGSTATPVIQGTPAAKITFKEIRMITTTDGWALTNSAVLKTSDGGAQWVNAGPLTTQIKNPVADFMNMQNAWIAATLPNSPNPNAIQVLRTQNGGQNWQSWSTSVLTTNADSMVGDAPHFVNTQDGWIELVTNGGPAAGSESVEIFATTNGGQNWSLIANTLSGNSGLPNGGLKSGISFKDALNGWATGGDYSYYPWLYVTHDGGHTWQKQGLPPNTATFNMTTPPVFFGNAGIMPVTLINNGNGGSTMMYITNNGGQSWTQASSTPASFQAQTVYAIDAQHAWAVDMNGLLYATSNGGHTWQKLLSSSLHMTQLSFVDDSNGWALGSTLLHTTDGGHTWHTV